MTTGRLSQAVTLAATLIAGEAAAQTATPPTPMDFAASVAQSDAYEILAARDALAQSRDPQVQAFARMMIDEHERMGASLRQAVTAAGLSPPPEAMSGDQAALLSSLQSLSGPAFDKAYALQQVLAHHQAIAVVRSFAAGGAEPTLRAAAQAAAPMIQRHLELAEHLRAAVGGS